MRYLIKTFFLFLVIFLLFEFVGYIVALIFHTNVMYTSFFFLGIAFLFNFISYMYSDKIVLRMYRAKILRKEEAPRLYQIVEEVAMRHGIPAPKVAVADLQVPNAFATGRNPENAVVVYTRGILRTLNEKELRAVTAHELAHIKHRDILIMTLAATMAAAISIAARSLFWSLWFGGGSDEEDSSVLLLAILAAITIPIAAMLIQLAISRTREYDADRAGAIAIRDPMSLASALRKLEAYQGRTRDRINPSTAHMFIVNPLKGGGWISLFSTHPPTEERIKRLMKIAEELGYFPSSFPNS